MRLGYRPELDGLRAVAVLAVMGFHLAKPIVSGGSLGVDVFFVLSGWLITSILASEAAVTGKFDYGGFLIRRALRLLPALCLLLAVYAATAPLLFPQFAHRRWFDIATALAYVTNLRETFQPFETPLSHTWSLGIEEQFYILWPLALRLPRRHAASGLVTAWAILTLARMVCASLLPGHPAAYYFTPLHATGLLLGAALALRPIDVGGGRIALAALVALFLGGQTRSYFTLAIPAAEVLTALVIAQPPRLLAAAPLKLLGRISYGVYLWHVPLFWAAGLPKAPAALAAVAAASIAAGALSHYAVERWFLTRGRSFGRRRAAADGHLMETTASP